MKRINSHQDLNRYVGDQLEGYQNELYGYEDFEEFKAKVAEIFLDEIKEENGFQWGDDLDDLDITDEDWRYVLRQADRS